MRNKAANRNPDEFYFGMHRSRVDGLIGEGGRSGGNTGKHVKTDEARMIEMEQKGLGSDAIRIMKDQDLAYVRMQRLMDRKKIERLQSSLHYLEGGDSAAKEDEGEWGGEETGGSSSLKKMVNKKRKHTVFVDGSQKEASDFDVAKHFDTIPELMGRSFNRPRVKDLEKQALLKLGVGKVPLKDADDDYYNDDDEEYDEDGNPIEQPKQLSEKQAIKQRKQQKKLERSIAKARSGAYTEMELRNARLKKLELAEAHLVVEKQCGMKGRKRKIAGKESDGEGGRPAVYKWRRKRAK